MEMEEDLEMDRDAVPPRLPKRRPAVPEFKVEIPSFTKHLLEQLEHHSGKASTHTLLPDLIAKLAVPIYFFTITATWYLGMFQVMPVFYPDSEDSGLFSQRVFMVLIYMELMLNWLCIRYVDSSYLAYLKKRWLRTCKNAVDPSRGGAETDGDPSLARLSENGSERRFENGGHGPGQGAYDQDDGSLPHSNSSGNSTTPWKPLFNPPRQTTYPYWSWVPCYVCQLMRPPRCHHCPLCQTCVLKRDHHCFFAESCVGWRNQRHFIVFGAWAAFGCSYASFYGIRYLASELWPEMRWLDLFGPVTLLRWVLGYVSGTVCLCVWVQSLLVYFIILSTSFVVEHVQLIRKGVTSFEISNLKKTVELRNTRGLAVKVRSVMGRWWLLNLLLPLHWVFEVEEDPEHWPSIKVYRH